MTYKPNLAMVQFLLSDEGADWLTRAASLPSSPNEQLASLEQLRRHLSPERAGAIWEQVRLRRRAAARFERAVHMLFTDNGLQQTTHPVVSAHRARRFGALGRVADLGCGLGADTLALAATVANVVAVERDPLRLRFARHNLAVYARDTNVHFACADLLRPPFSLDAVDACFCDPARRSRAGRRAFRPNDYRPPLNQVWERWRGVPGLAVKVGPGIDYESLTWVDEVEVISLNGQVREAVLWCGRLATSGVRRRATLLPGGATISDEQPDDACLVKPAGRYLYEPDGAIIRAGLVRQLGAALALHQLDPRIAYLSGEQRQSSTFVQGFEIEEQMPFNLKRLRSRLRALDVGVLEIKKRGVALNPDTFRRRLKLSGAAHKTLIVTRIGDKPQAFLCKRLG